MIKGIVFDKDGTLLDYEKFWLPIAKEACSQLLKENNYDLSYLSDILEKIGAYDGISGILCHGTYSDIAGVMNTVLNDNFITANDVSSAVENNLYLGELVPACDRIREVLAELKAQGLILAIVTSDNSEMTEYCLKKLGIADIFDVIYSDDGAFVPKPKPDQMLDFCRRYSLVPSEVIMVGDTLSDMRFAKNSGTHSVGVAKNVRDEEIISPMAEYVLHDISLISSILSEFTVGDRQ